VRKKNGEKKKGMSFCDSEADKKERVEGCKNESMRTIVANDGRREGISAGGMTKIPIKGRLCAVKKKKKKKKTRATANQQENPLYILE